MLHLVQTNNDQPLSPIALAQHFAETTYEFYARQNPFNADQFDQANRMMSTTNEETRRLSELYTARAICGSLCAESMEEMVNLEASLAPITSEIV